MKPPRWLIWLANLLLLVAILVTGAHAHHGGVAQERDCIACTLAHAPAVATDRAPGLSPPAPTHDGIIEPALLVVTPPLCAIPSSRAPPLG